MKVLPVAWFDGLARILTKVEEIGVWPEGLHDAEIATTPKADGDASPLVSDNCAFSCLCTVLGLLPLWCSWRNGFGHGSLTRSSVVVVAVRLRLGFLLHWILRSFYVGY